ncbi:Hypothetical protein NocV09_00400830 [Nannochloropsis oceanica]
MPAALPGWMGRIWSSVSHITAPHIRKLVHYGGEVLRPGEDMAERCKKRRKPIVSGADTGTGDSSSSGSDTGLDACTLLDVSWSLGQQLGNLGKNASAKTAWWLSQEVPRVALPFHLMWVELAVEVYPVTRADVASLILHQRPHFVVQLCDILSEYLVRALHSIPMLDFLINARYDLLYIPDAACPLTQVDGLIFRAPLTAEGFCEIRPCEHESSIAGQTAAGGVSPFCECDLTKKRCRLRAQSLRDFQLLVDEPLASKTFDAQASTSVAWVTVPDWFPPRVQTALQGLLPLYVFNFLVGLLFLWFAEPLSRSTIFHVFLSAILGLFSGLLLAGVVLNQMIRTVKKLQPFSGLATLMTSVVGVVVYHRFRGGAEILLLLAGALKGMWGDRWGQAYLVGSGLLGWGLAWGLGWWEETEEECREKRGGWIKAWFNGQRNIRVGLTVLGLSFLWRSVPTPTMRVVVVLLVLLREWWGYALHRLHMYRYRSPETHRFLAREGKERGRAGGMGHRARGGDEDDDIEEEEEEGDDYTTRALRGLRTYVQKNPESTHRVRHGRGEMERFKGGGPDYVRGDEEEEEEEEEEGRTGRGCCVM